MKIKKITLKDIMDNNSILSPSFYINKEKNKYPYVFRGGIYCRVSEYNLKGKEEFYTELQAKHINNLLSSIKEINKEIERIKKCEDYDNEIKKQNDKDKIRKYAKRLSKKRK